MSELVGAPVATGSLDIALYRDDIGTRTATPVLYATEAFRARNPKTYNAFVLALEEAARFVTDNPEAAADTYIRVPKAKIDRKLLIDIIRNPEVSFTIVPHNTLALAQFMHRVGAIKNRPESVADYFFDDSHSASGN